MSEAIQDGERRASHDQIFKTAFSLFLQDLVELVDPSLAATLDLRAPRFIEKEAFTDFPGGERAEADLVAEAKIRRGEPRLVLVHGEVESKFRQTIDRRTWRYFMHLELKYDVPVISVVVFLTGGPPGVERRVVVESVGSLEISRFTYLAFGLSRSLAEAWVDRPQPLAGALAALMRSEVWDNVERKLRCLGAVSRTGLDDARRFVLKNIVDTYIPLDPDEEARFEAQIEQEANKEVRDMVITLEDAMAEREARGEAQGEARGLARGKVEEAREAVLLVLRHRFGSIPPTVEARLETIDGLDRLHGIMERSLEIRSIENLDLDR